jgi:hypothetical protein
LELPHRRQAKWETRGQESAEIRKRMVAAYMCLCREIGADIRYAGDLMLLQMSDHCIRDFLAQIHELFLESAKPLGDFVREQIPSLTQHRALARASRQKRSSCLVVRLPGPQR